MNSDILERLKRIAWRSCFYDKDAYSEDLNYYVYGNVDDAFDLGAEAGRVSLARELLSLIEKEEVEHSNEK